LKEVWRPKKIKQVVLFFYSCKTHLVGTISSVLIWYSPCSLSFPSEFYSDSFFTLKCHFYCSRTDFGCLFLVYLPTESRKTLQIEGNTDQGPLTRHRLETPQHEPTEAHHCFDNAEYWFHRGFAFGLELFPGLGFQTMLHGG
jgi:hypothetical protein